MLSFKQMTPVVAKAVVNYSGAFATRNPAALFRLNASVGVLFGDNKAEILQQRFGEVLFYTCNYCNAAGLEFPKPIDSIPNPHIGLLNALGSINRGHYFLESGKGDRALIIASRDDALCRFCTCLHDYARLKTKEDSLYLLNLFLSDIRKSKS